MSFMVRRSAILGCLAVLCACQEKTQGTTKTPTHTDTVNIAAFRLSKPKHLAGDPRNRPQPSPSAQDLLVALGWAGDKMPDGYNDAEPLGSPQGTYEVKDVMGWALASPY